MNCMPLILRPFELAQSTGMWITMMLCRRQNDPIDPYGCTSAKTLAELAVEALQAVRLLTTKLLLLQPTSFRCLSTRLAKHHITNDLMNTLAATPCFGFTTFKAKKLEVALTVIGSAEKFQLAKFSPSSKRLKPRLLLDPGGACIDQLLRVIETLGLVAAKLIGPV